MINQQKLKKLNLTDKELNVLLSAILEDLQELLPDKEREKLHKMLKDSKERTKILEELKERCNCLSWEL